MGIACAQQDVAHVYPLPDDPERCLEDFADRAADHARAMAERLDHQEASVRRFLELNGGDGLAETGAERRGHGCATAAAPPSRPSPLLAFLALCVALLGPLADHREPRARRGRSSSLRAQARGDAPADARAGSTAAAPTRAAGAGRARNAPALRRPATVKILRLRLRDRLRPRPATGRRAWRGASSTAGCPSSSASSSAATGTVLAGHSITLRRLSRPIGRESSC